VLYLDRQWANAIRELTAAQELGAPLWRVSYHLGLVAEAQGQIDEARRRYTDALEANPGWPIAQARLTGLGLPPATVIR
jgi:Flp pilus assembly protein TadD